MNQFVYEANKLFLIFKQPPPMFVYNKFTFYNVQLYEQTSTSTSKGLANRKIIFKDSCKTHCFLIERAADELKNKSKRQTINW